MIILGGVKHSGKSTQARKLSQYFAWTNYDLDDIAVAEFVRQYPDQGVHSPRDIYKTYGKESWLQAEVDGARWILAKNRESDSPLIVSLGGGTIDNPSAMELLGQTNSVEFFIDAPAPVLYERILRGGLPPFLQGENPEALFKELYQDRKTKYLSRQPTVVDAGQMTIGEVFERLKRTIEEQLSGRI